MRTETRSWHPWIAFGTVALVVFLLVVGAGARHAFAAVCDAPTKTWDGGGGNDLWSTANNWNPNGVPGTSDDVCLSGASVRVTTPASVRSFQVSSGTLTVESTGGLGLAQPSSIDTGAQLVTVGNINGNSTSILSNDGTVNLIGNSLISTKVTNQGEIDSSAPSTAILSAGLTNAGSGTVHVLSGTLDLRGPTTSNGTMQVDQGGTLSHDSGIVEYQTGSITGQGQMLVAGGSVTLDPGMTYGLNAFQVNSGTLTLNSDYTVDTVTLNSGVLTGSGNLTIRNALTMAIFATMNRTGSATTTVQSGGTATLATGAPGQSVTIGRPLTIDSGATLTVTGDGQLATSGGPGSIANSGTMNVPGNSQLNVPTTNAASGTLTKSSSGTTSIGGNPFVNNGTLTVSAGTLSIGGQFTNYNQATDVLTGGTFNVSGILKFTGADIVTNQSTITLSGSSASIQDTSGNDGFRDFTTNPGSLTVTGGKTLTLPKALSSTGSLVVGPSSALGAPSVTLNGGTLSGAGTVAAAVSNPGGTVSPGFSPGALAITGSYAQGAGGALPIEIGGTTAGVGYDQLNVSGAATLNGTLTLSTLSSFAPQAGQTFTIMTYASHTGCFPTIDGRDLSADGPALFYDVSCGASSAVVTVKEPHVSIGDVTVAEGDSGTTQATFTVSVTTPRPDAGLSVDFTTTDGTAVAPDDYTARAGTISWAPGDGSDKTVTVDVAGDTLDEFDEAFTVGLSNPTRVVVDDASGTGTILDNDPPPTVSIGDATVTEGDSGTTQATFTVSLSGPSGKPISVDYATTDGTATSPDDYAAGSGTLHLASGQTSKQISVDVNGDALDEFDESFTVGLSAPSNVVILDGSGSGTISDDDPPPTVSIVDAAPVGEGDAGTSPATFTVTLSAPSGKPISVDYATSDGTATSPDDYSTAADTLSFAPGQTSTQISVDVKGDALDEADETFSVDLSNPSNVMIGDGSGTGTISDDDPLPTVSIDDAAPVEEGDAGTSPATFTVSLSTASGRSVLVDYVTADGTATAPGDYASESGTLTFAPGQTSKLVSVDVKGDSTFEGNETFTVDLANPVHAAIGDGSATGTISDDDAAPTLSIDDVTVTEGNSGTTQAAFTVTLAGPTALAATVDFATQDGTATAPSDYSAASGTLTFGPGDTSKQVVVNVKGDATVEPDETFTVELANATNATIADGSGTGTITNDDSAAPLTISIDDRSQNEGDSGTAPMTFTVSLSNTSAQTVTVHYATANGTAVSGSDYVAKSGTLSFAPGITSKPVNVSIKGDLVDEADEAFAVNLSQAVNAQIADGSGTGTIVDDDPKVPVITGFGSTSAVQGGTVAIKGSHFTGVTKVTFAKAGGGTVDAVTFTVASDTKITATVPALATTGRVSVTNAAGSATSPADLLIKPKIDGFTPGSGPVGTVVTITGSGFTGATNVQFRGLDALVFTVDSDTQITVTVPKKARTGKIAVITAGGKGTSATSFTVL